MIETNQSQQYNIQLLATNIKCNAFEGSDTNSLRGWRNDYVIQIDLEVGGHCSCFHANIKFSFQVNSHWVMGSRLHSRLDTHGTID